MGYYSRTIIRTLRKLSEEFPAVIITGNLGVGKTTLLKDYIENSGENITFVTLDNLKDRSLAIENPELF